MAYDTPLMLDNIFDHIDGEFLFFDPSSCSGCSCEGATPLFSVPTISDTWHVDPNERDMIRVYGDMSGSYGGMSIPNWLAANNVRVEFRANFRIVDTNPGGLTPDFYVIHQIRGQFKVVDTNYDLIGENFSCDPWGDNVIFFKLDPTIKYNQFLSPHSAAGYLCHGRTNQCELRYFIMTQDTEGGIPLQDDFPGEYRPVIQYPDEITFAIPNVFEFVGADYFESPTQNLPNCTGWSNNTSNPSFYLSGLADINNSVPGFVTIENIHANYPKARTIDKSGASTQGMFFHFERTCPTVNEYPIAITDFELIKPVYTNIQSCRTNIFTAPPMYSNLGESVDLSIQAISPVITTSNPVTIPIFINNTGGQSGTGLGNCFIYAVSPLSSSIVFSIAGVPVPQSGGMFELGNINTAGLTLEMTVSFNCPGECATISSIPITIHYGNYCPGYPVLSGGNLNPEPCYTESFNLDITVPITQMGLNVDNSIIDSCGQVHLDVTAENQGADASNLFLGLLTNPLGNFTLQSATCTTFGNQDMMPFLSGSELNLSSFLLSIGENPLLRNDQPLSFHFALNPNCNVISGNYAFLVSLDGLNLCGQPCHNELSGNFNYQAAVYSANPTTEVSGPITLECGSIGQYQFDIAGIDNITNGEVTIEICVPQALFCNLNFNPAPTTSLGNGCHIWTIPVASSTGVSVTLEGELCTEFECGSYPLVWSVSADWFAQCCPTCTSCDYVFEEASGSLQLNACCSSCSADFEITQLSNCCYLFEDLTPGILPCDAGGWGIFNASDTSWVAMNLNSATFEHCFEQNGEYLICSTVCCANGDLDKSCQLVTVTGCSCDADFSVTQLDNCCFKFQDESPDIIPCDTGGWGIFTLDEQWVATYLDTDAVYHCFESDGEYLVCNTVCCPNGDMDKECLLVTVTECACNISMEVSQVNECCYLFTQIGEGTLPCPIFTWTVADDSNNVLYTQQGGSELFHCFSADGNYSITLENCCGDEWAKTTKEIRVSNCDCRPKFEMFVDDNCCHHFIPNFPVNTKCDGDGWYIFNSSGELIFADTTSLKIVYCFPVEGTYLVCMYICCEDGEVKKLCKEIDIRKGCCMREAFFEIYPKEDPCCFRLLDPTSAVDGCRRWDIYDEAFNPIYSTDAGVLEYCLEPGTSVLVCLTDCCIKEGEVQEIVQFCQEITCTERRAITQNGSPFQVHQVLIFPNPNNGSFTLRSSTNSLIIQAKIYDSVGNLVGDHVMDEPQSEIQLRQLDLSSGYYTIHVSTTSGIEKIRCLIAK